MSPQNIQIQVTAGGGCLLDADDGIFKHPFSDFCHKNASLASTSFTEATKKVEASRSLLVFIGAQIQTFSVDWEETDWLPSFFRQKVLCKPSAPAGVAPAALTGEL